MERDLERLRQLNRWFGSHRLVSTFIRRWIRPADKLRVVDLATGSGDIPRLIVDYARKISAKVEIDAFDRQPATLEIARRLSADYPEISYREANILEWNSVEAYDITLCTLALHHFSNEDAVRLLRRCREISKSPHTQLIACGRAVGLPDGQMGNSEVGHLNLGAGAVVRQDLVRIDDAIADGSLAANDGAARRARGRRARAPARPRLRRRRALLARAPARADRARARARRADDVVVHAFTDGRDTLPHAGARLLARARRHASGARVGSVIGRYWAMDRDRRWERTQRAYDLLVHGDAPSPRRQRRAGGRATPTSAARPTSSSSRRSSARRRGSRPGDSVLCFNFRPDRMRQIVARARRTRASATRGSTAAGRRRASAAGAASTLTEYEEGWPYPVAFAPERPATTLARGDRAARAPPAARRRDREVPARDVLLQRRRGGAAARASGASWCPRRATCRPTTTSREMSAREAADGVRGGMARGRAALRDHQLRQRRHGRAHGRDPGGGVQSPLR